MNKLNYISIGENGTFRGNGSFKTSPQDVDDIFICLRNENVENITLHIHGGLIDESAGIQIAKMMTPVYSAVNSHPITFVWQTGPFDTIKDQILTIHKTKIFKFILKTVAKIVINYFRMLVNKKEVIRFEDSHIEEELTKDIPFAFLDNMDDINREILNNKLSDVLIFDSLLLETEFLIEFDSNSEFEELIETDKEGIILFKKEIRESLNYKNSNFMGALKISMSKVVRRIVLRFKRRRDHGAMATFTEELLRELYIDNLGSYIWDGMKLKAREMWDSNNGLSGDNQHAARYFLDKLEKLKKDQPEIKINCVGDSAGSIVICHLLGLIAAEKYKCTFETITFLAPACRVKLFNNHIVNNPSMFKRFRIFTMGDYYEIRDHLLGKVYPRSLLYLVSGLLEKGFDEYILGLERHVSAKFPYNNSRELKIANKFLYSSSYDRLVYSVTPDSAPVGKRSQSRKHGDFDCDHLTQESLQKIIR